MIKKFAVITGVLLLVAVVAATGCPPQAEPATPADFYKGKTIDLIISAAPGTDEDLITRIIAPYLGGDTGASVVVTNRVGAGGLDAMNYVYKSKPDGLTLGTAPTAKFVPNKVFNEPAAIYEIENFSYIISIGRVQYYFLVAPDGPCQSVADLQAATDLKIGGSSPSGSICLSGLTVIKLLGLDAKVITGLSGDSNRALAAKRGEIIGYCSNIPSAKASLEAGMVKPLFVLATERDPLTPDVPAITEVVNMGGEDLALVKLWETTFFNSTLLVAPPGIAEDRLRYLRDLANQWVQDEGFREGINAVSGYELQDQEYIAGEEVTKVMLDLAAAFDEFRAIFLELIEKYRA
ncbi:MAG: hypothetical protein HQ588_04775 [Deltaproteobacteria bacterium]|nr:hypothetical protein [Deltaproteobacteria bacterium]